MTRQGIDAELLARLETLIVSDILPNATTSLAHYLLPGCAHAEKRGTFTNSKGEITGVKYERLDLLLINAVKEQQQQIERQQKQIARLVTSNAALNTRLRNVEKALRKKVGSARRRR